ncbi:MAG: zinc ribbon domain-containing protein [Thauera phenolivorans]|uniref:Zinc ribbon domain-containing protein n=1 Tax=Thauera phenolivorans TaxID=1792543 RepID=A0A7X7LWP6_9RHOO|nr:zinc ribbon domain-containing protein [Thauera phenolivorans]NLF54769.1 zinc ribbon domain-containing protein [Thauera phenolivorans]
MATTRCTFCQHDNPDDAQFCNACGSSLKLQLCEGCGAINDITAPACHKCGKPFPQVVANAAPGTNGDPEQVPAGETPAALPPGRSAPQVDVRTTLIGLVVLALLAALAYLALRPADEPAPPPAAAGTVAPAAPAAVSSVPDARETAPEPPVEPVVEPVVEPPPQPALDRADEAVAGEAAAAQEEASAPPADPALNAVVPTAPPPKSTTACEPALDALGLCDHPQR